MICCSVQWLRKLKSTSCGDFVMLFLLKNYNDKFHARINVIAQRQKCNKKMEGNKSFKVKDDSCDSKQFRGSSETRIVLSKIRFIRDKLFTLNGSSSHGTPF